MSAFTTELEVRFGHVDAAGIAYYPRIFEYLHDAFEALFAEHVGVRYPHLVQELRIGFPLVHSDVDFESPLRFGDRPRIEITCYQLGTSSLGLRYRFYVGERRALEARQITVCIALDTMRPCPLPDEFRAKLAELLERA